MQRSRKRQKVTLIVYHSIAESGEDRIRSANVVTPENFERQIQYLASNASIISLADCLDYIQSRRPLAQKSVVITFDDGYKDNLTRAAPILQKYCLPATFFVPTHLIGTGMIKWEDRLHCMFKRWAGGSISLSLTGGPVQLKIHSEDGKERAINYLVDLLSHLSQAEREQCLAHISQALNVSSADLEDVMMTWEDVRKLADIPGMSIGSHSATHQHLTRITPGAVEEEITRSKVKLEYELGQPVVQFSYPYGDLNTTVVSAVKDAGYSCGVTLEYGMNSLHSDPFRLKRIQVPDQSGLQFRFGLRLRESIFGNVLRSCFNALYRKGTKKINTKNPVQG